MTTKLERNISVFEGSMREEHGNGHAKVIQSGITGGSWLAAINCDGIKPYARAMANTVERNNCSRYIVEHGDFIPSKARVGKLYRMDGCYVVLGAKTGGSFGRSAKQCYYAIVTFETEEN